MQLPNLEIKKIFKKPKLSVKLPRFYLFSDNISSLLFLLSLCFLVFYTAYIVFFYNYLPTQIPLWFSLPWGVYRLSTKLYLFFVPFVNLTILLFGVYLTKVYIKNNIKEVSRFLSSVVLVTTFALFLSSIQIVNNSTEVAYSLGFVSTNFVLPALVAFLVSFLTTRLIIYYAPKLKIIEYPNIRNEPAGILKRPTPRFGAGAFFAGFTVSTLLFLNTSQRAWGLILGLLITTVTGYLDDRYKLNYLPRLLVLLPLSFIVVILSGFVMLYIPNPFGDPIKLDSLRYSFELFNQPSSIVVWGAVVAFIWFLWMSNMVSWNNGTDGQFVAITSVLAVTIAVLSFRFNDLSYEQLLSAKLSLITLGAILGLFYHTLPPNKIIWGFGATGVGLVLAALSILSGTRVATALLVLLLPSIDTLYVIINRIRQKKSPFKGDNNHLHHKLLQIGFSKRQVALFYWGVSLIFMGLAIFSSGRLKLLTIITLSGLILWLILIIRYYSVKITNKQK